MAPEKCKIGMQYAFNYSGARFLSTEKLKLLNFMMDSILILI